MKMPGAKRLSVVIAIILTQFAVSAVSAEQVWKAADGIYRYGDPDNEYYSMFVITEEGSLSSSLSVHSIRRDCLRRSEM